ncbi:alpha-keto acid decarboxylase family protein [Virgibacillus alimentarius]|uniref:Alpha-keto-acid decarboxylase n=1 Tax=Virgibacillus alimentarius TaxID=698769 RepID=A0ABS4SBX0_9BACI|nr:alpha-keto acid decarboxylase family protein [Virgibacillus alimentarius]MBP2258857.1 indolepyruvate decarboxylase [Virgibacillus alimentarius]
MNYTVGHFLIDEINKAGVDKIFGVPGDFNLTFLDTIMEHPYVEWIGNTNELNASYAADGYARVKGIGALVTTFGVGELSTVNGIAGAYAERVPVIAITGAPTTVVERGHKYVHHTLGEGNYDDFRKVFKPITCAQAYITQANAQEEIPRVIQVALSEKRPVHIHLPIDVAAMPLTSVDQQVSLIESRHKDALDTVLKTVQARLNESKQPVIITGHEINSFKAHQALQTFSEQTKIPVAQLSLGKSAFDETHKNYLGMYAGSVSEEYVRNYVDESDLILNLGAKLTDSATSGFSHGFNEEDMIVINHRLYRDNDIVIEGIPLLESLDALNKHIDFKNNTAFETHKSNVDFTPSDRKLTQNNYFKLMNQFLKPYDVILAEQGTSFFGGYTMSLPKNTTFIGQPLWGSIGYTLGALLGTQLADEKRRNILLIGDGSLQLTVQTLSTMIRENLKPIIFCINNDGYTVERMIHGADAKYNDIKMWNYCALPSAFGAEDEVKTHLVETEKDLVDVFNKINEEPNKMHFIEVKMEVLDAPDTLKGVSKAFAAQNK